MSATLDHQLFIQYFARPVAGKHEPAPRLKVDGHTYDVAEYYLEDLKDLGKVSMPSASVAHCAIFFLILCNPCGCTSECMWCMNDNNRVLACWLRSGFVDVKVKARYSSSWESISELWGITQCYLPPDTSECTPP